MINLMISCAMDAVALRAQRLKNSQDHPPGSTSSSENEHLKRATHRCLFLWGILKVKTEVSSEIETDWCFETRLVTKFGTLEWG